MIYDGVGNKSCSNVLEQVSSSTKMKKTSIDNQREEVQDSSRSSKLLLGRKESIRLKIQARGPICKSRRKKVGPLGLVSKGKDQEQEDDDDLDMHFDEEERSSWLSNGGISISSPSYCCSDDQIFRNLLKFSLDDWLVSLFISSSTNLLSPRFINTKTVFFDGSTVNPLEDATFFVLQKSSSYQEEIFQENVLSEEEEDITTWLTKSVEIEDEIKSSKWDTQKMGFLGSLIDLNGENSEWISDSGTDVFNINLPIDFPSPSCKNNWSSESQSLIITTTPPPLYSQQKENKSIYSTAKYAAEEDKKYEQNELTDLGGDHEPIFWPCDTKFDWDSEFSWDFLVISPRKNIRKPGNSKGKLQERIKMALRRAKMDFEKEDTNICYRSSAKPGQQQIVLETNSRSTKYGGKMAEI